MVAQEGELHSFQLFEYDVINSSFIDPFKKTKTAYIYKGEKTSIGTLLKVDNKLRKHNTGKEASLIENTLILYEKYDDYDILHPFVASFDYYKKVKLEDKFSEGYYKEVKKRLKQKAAQSQGYGSKSLTLVSRDIAGTNLSLNIDGNISINGKLIFENKDLVNLNSQDNKSWDLDINQTQRFNIEGKVGDKLSVKVKQDSEANFDFENNMIITYEGEDNEIIQEVQAGNISLNLPSTQFVNVGSGKSEGLFGVKMVNRFGPLEVQGIISRQQVKKSSKSFTPDGSGTDGTYINDYNFIKDRYFFIDENFKSSFYPLNENLQHSYYSDYVIYRFEVFKRVTNIESGVVPGVAYLNPSDETSYKEEGSWVRLEEGLDYEIDQLLGYIRFKSLSSQDIIGLSYEIGQHDGSQIVQFQDPNPFPTYTVFYDDYLANLDLDPNAKVQMKLVKSQGMSTPNSPTWPLMFKNVYSLGGSNIELDQLEVEIAYVGGVLEEQTHSEINDNSSFLNLFGLDTKDQNDNNSAAGDGIIDYQYPSLIRAQYGELFFPTYLPFAYDSTGVWGSNVEDIGEVLNTSLNDSDNNFSDESDSGPSMYYSTNNQSILEEHEFVLKVRHSQSQRSATINLGFMIVEGSEVVRLNGQTLLSGSDYTIDYFTGTLNLINENALDPTANLDITYEENELLSFDQKLLTGLHFKYDYSDNDYLNGGLYYYNQSIVDERVDFGFEPMRNFIWNISGKYDQEVPLLTDAVNLLPFIDTNKPSKVFVESEYAHVYPNPNPIGRAFLDDFESSKRTSSPGIMQRHWKEAAPPIVEGDSLNVIDRGAMSWYNPFVDLNTQDIWPQQEVSNQANNTTTKTLFIQTNHDNESMWNGISTQLYSSDFDQSQSKYLDIWLNSNSVLDSNLILHIDIGYISEDRNNNGVIDTEDEDIYGPGLGDGILDDNEDIGLDGCLDLYETGWGGCLDILGPTFEEYCISNDMEYINYELCYDDEGNLNSDPNGDNWYYEPYSNNYTQINGTEGNGQSSDYRYPDTEDLDNDQSLDAIDDYFTYQLNPSSNVNLESQTYSDGIATGWKMYRILLSEFNKENSSSNDPTISWDDVRTMRLWVDYDSSNDVDESEFDGNNLIKIAKIEIVGNEWTQLGVTNIDEITNDSFDPDSTFAVTVINTQDNSEYEQPPGVVGEYDEFTNIRLKEQSLVLDFYPTDEGLGGISSDDIIGIKKVLTNLSNDNKDNFFAYNFMEMFVYGNPLDTLNSSSWFNDDEDSSNVDLLFRLGKDDEFYELRQPVFEDWDNKNHVKINLDELTRYKLNIQSLDEFDDTGQDGVFSDYENGCFDIDTLAYGGYLENNLKYSDIYTEALEIEGENFYEYISIDNDGARICGPLHWDFYGPSGSQGCNSCSAEDPNGDDYTYTQIGQSFFNLSDPKFGFENIDEDGFYIGLEGDGKWQDEEPLTDYNNNGIFDYPPDYIEEQELWEWTESNSDIDLVCDNCSEFRIKGKPAINRIEYIVIGVVNNADEKIYGKIYLDELRLTGVKKDEGKAFRFKSSVDFSDLLSLNVEYKNEDADFHRLEERLGSGDTHEYMSLQTTFNPDKFLPSKWGFKIPFNLNLSSSIKTPKYYPTQPDILTESDSSNIVPDSIKAINKTVSFSSSFNKTTKSDNWLLRSTIDKLSLNYSIINKNNSSVDIRSDEVNNADFSVAYSYNFDKSNYITPFKFFENIPLIGDPVSSTKIYYSPEKFSTNMSVSEAEQNKIMRTGVETNTYDLNMTRSFVLNHKFTETLKSNYKKNITSDLDFFMEEYGYSKTDFINQLSPGLIKNYSEDLNNTYSPDILSWLDPSIKYHPYYTWVIDNQSDEIPSATIENKTNVETSFNFSPKDFVGIFYKPESTKKKSSNKRRGRNTSSKKTTSEPLFKIENEKVKEIFDGIYDYASKVSKVTVKYTYNTVHRHTNIRSDQFVDYDFRLGLIWTPEELQYNDTNDQISSYYHDFDRELRVSLPTLTIIPNLSVTGIEFKNRTSNSIESSSSPDSSRVVSYLPLGVRGDKGLPMISWGLSYSGFEKNELINKYFQTFKLSHNYSGDMTETFINEELQRKDFSFSFSPLIKLDAKTKGADPIRFEISFKHIIDINNEGTTTERIYKNTLGGKLNFSRSEGITVPFLGEFKNNTNFSIDVDLENNYTLFSTQLVDNIDDFNLQSESTTFSFKPNISYNFSKYVNGTIYYNYILTEDLTTGKNTENDFGFTINIKIQG